jgi:hypothetical protein
MKLFQSVVSVSFLALSLFAAQAHAVDMGEVEKELTTTGVTGWIHGSVQGQGLYVFTYRTPGNFFDYIEMSLIPGQAGMLKTLSTFDRHDQVRIKGKFADIPAPQKHILVSSIELVQKYDSGYPTPPHDYMAKIPDDLLKQNAANFLVHAVAGNGQILVLEYKDAIVPVFVSNGKLAQNLFRGDVIHLTYKIQAFPDQPTHLNVDETVANPLQVIDSIQAQNGKQVTLEGALILFPKSPEIEFNVFAVQQLLSDGLSRQFTLVNFDDANLFQKIRDTLQKAWDQSPHDYVNGRNKLVSTKIRVKATGTINEVDPSQANPQILLKSLDSIVIE